MESFLEILKYTIPALVVFMTAYFILKMHLEEQQKAHFYALKTEQLRLTLPVRLQAYERLAIMLERIGIPSLIGRMRSPEMTVGNLHLALMLAIQQEFDHNVAQQIYVSDTIWKITTLAKDGSLQIIDHCAANLQPGEPAEKLVGILLANVDQQNSFVFKALQALREEAGTSF